MSSAVERRSMEVDGTQLSFLAAGEGPVVGLLLHGTWWSRVWEPVMPVLAEYGAVYALDLPGFGRSSGSLVGDGAAVPRLARWVVRFADALGLSDPLAVVGHDIGGAIAQHLAVYEPTRVDRLGLVNAVLYDSWPVPAVARFRDPDVAASTTVEEFVQQRGASLDKAVVEPLDDATRAAYLEPFLEPQRMRSWMAMAAAADARFTLDLLPGLRARGLPTQLVWGADDEFQPVRFAARFAAEMPHADLVRLNGARHIPMEDRAADVAAALGAFLARSPAG